MFEMINYYDYNDELKQISLHLAFNKWVESFGGRRIFLREVRSMGSAMVLINFNLFVRMEYDARLPIKGDSNFQPKIWNIDRLIGLIRNTARIHQEESLKARRKYILLSFLIGGILSWLYVFLK